MVLSHDANCWSDMLSEDDKRRTRPHWHYNHISDDILSLGVRGAAFPMLVPPRALFEARPAGRRGLACFCGPAPALAFPRLPRGGPPFSSLFSPKKVSGRAVFFTHFAPNVAKGMRLTKRRTWCRQLERLALGVLQSDIACTSCSPRSEEPAFLEHAIKKNRSPDRR